MKVKVSKSGSTFKPEGQCRAPDLVNAEELNGRASATLQVQRVMLC